ncbi:MAG: autotransporter outer membrane beta-barrel domain-containing protein [Halioglobus sp.]
MNSFTQGSVEHRILALVGGCACVGMFTVTEPCHAGLEALAGEFANEVEEESARANQATYESLLLANGGPCPANLRMASENCTGDTFNVFNSTRELVQTANELTGSGPTEFSLGVDLTGLGTALRWTSGEEFSGQGSLSSELVTAQLSGLASRITALRFGATGFSIAGLNTINEESLAGSQPSGQAYGMGASADTVIDGFSRWGGFLNGSYGYGDKEPTGNENAFNFDGFEVNAGVDYRWDDQWVTGLVAGYLHREVDFEPVGIIVVDGGIDADGFSLMPFALYQSDSLFASISFGYQQLSFDTDRAIKYPSLNPDVSSTNTRTSSSTDSDGWSASGSLGYGFTWGAVSLEPYLSAEYRDTEVDGFTERDVNGDGFDLIVSDQGIESFEGGLGVRLQYTWTPSFGVFLPYLDLQSRHQFLDDSRNIKAAYRGASDAVDQQIGFRVATDELDSQYYSASLGVSAVVRGARQTSDGPAAGGIQAYIAYRTVMGLRDYTHDVVTGGLRYEF